MTFKHNKRKSKMEKKVVLITGASSGIGEVTAKWLKKEGYTVYGAARRKDKMEKELGPYGIYCLYMDLTVDETIVNCVNTIIEKEGKIDVLINNAVYANFGSLEESPIEVARMHYEVNILGMGRLNQLVIPHMRKHKFGKIVNLSSGAGKVAGPFNGWYASTKFAIECLSDTMAYRTETFWNRHYHNYSRCNKNSNVRGGRTFTPFSFRKWIYGKPANKLADTMRKLDNIATPPKDIAYLITKAIQAKKPKTRYVIGKRAKTFLFFRKFLSDRFFDEVILREFFN